jgi:hypothetical protein
MLMTEKEAKDRLGCPYSRMIGESSIASGYNRTKDGRPSFWQCNCLASGCAAWRFVRSSTPSAGQKGYCGLAGPPIS